MVFAVNSAVHSYLVLAYTDEDSVALNVGFYYMANARGRLLGTLLSGIVTTQFAFPGLPVGICGANGNWLRFHRSNLPGMPYRSWPLMLGAAKNHSMSTHKRDFRRMDMFRRAVAGFSDRFLLAVVIGSVTR